MSESTHYTIFPIGDTALTIDFGNQISEAVNQQVLTLFNRMQQQPLAGIVEAVPAYSSLTLYYDLYALRRQLPSGHASVYAWLCEELRSWLRAGSPETAEAQRTVTIPVCYEKTFAPDLEAAASAVRLSVEEYIHLYQSRSYRVYMLGFIPGFAYMGELDARIAMPRKPKPAPVAAGSIGIAGRQTGIYPLASPGGWQIIGRTPLSLFDARGDQHTLLKPGDRVQFVSISRNEFANY